MRGVDAKSSSDTGLRASSRTSDGFKFAKASRICANMRVAFIALSWTHGAGSTKHHLHSISPVHSQSDRIDVNFRRKISDERIRCVVKAQCRSNKKKTRRNGSKRTTGKIAQFGEIIAPNMPMDANPIIQRLQRQVEVLRGFHLHHRQTALVIHG